VQLASCCVRDGESRRWERGVGPVSIWHDHGHTHSVKRGTDEDDDAVLSPAEPDFVLVNLPTGMRLPLFKGNFRLTHRFAGNLRRGTFSQQASNLFGIDQGAIIGFEYRMAVARHVQASFYRSSFDKTIQFHGKYDAVRQGRSMPVSVSALASIEGTDNFQEKYAPSVGMVVSRILGTRVAAYVTPMWANNTAASLDVRRSTTFIGLGGRARVGGSTYVAAEIVPRVSGYAPDEPAYGVSIEKRVGSHMFSLTFTNSFGTTFAQVARGGAANTLFLTETDIAALCAWSQSEAARLVGAGS
jgi:hypothetical protein